MLLPLLILGRARLSLLLAAIHILRVFTVEYVQTDMTAGVGFFRVQTIPKPEQPGNSHLLFLNLFAASNLRLNVVFTVLRIVESFVRFNLSDK